MVFSGDVPLSELGRSLKCDKDDEFAEIINEKIGESEVTLFLKCPQCGNKWKNTYKFGQFIRMANMALIDKPKVIEFQKKLVVRKGKYLKLDEGLEGAYYVDPDDEDKVKRDGRKLLCNHCNHFYSLSVRKFKKSKIYLRGHCPNCGNTEKKIKIPVESAFALGRAGLIDTHMMSSIREEYEEAQGKKYDTSESYTMQDGTMSYHVRERLGMVGDTKRTKCYICGASLSEDAERCPKCGSDVDLDF